MSSQGRLTADGIAPVRYDEETRYLIGGGRRTTVLFRAGDTLLDDGRSVPALPGSQDSASQFVQLTWLFLTGREAPRIGHVLRFPLALPRRLYQGWQYEVVGDEAGPGVDLASHQALAHEQVMRLAGVDAAVMDRLLRRQHQAEQADLLGSQHLALGDQIAEIGVDLLQRAVCLGADDGFVVGVQSADAFHGTLDSAGGDTGYLDGHGSGVLFCSRGSVAGAGG